MSLPQALAVADSEVVVFDALNPARTLWEIKTSNYSRYPLPKDRNADQPATMGSVALALLYLVG